MGTRAAAFAAKIRSLQEFYSRLQNGGLPQPATLDVANALKYFSTTLLGVLKDVPSISLEIMGSADHDHYRISLFPNLDYVGLYNVLIQMVEILPQIPTGAGLGQSLLHTISCLIPFIDHDMMDQLSYVVSQAVAILPATGHKEVLDMLCFNIFPFTLTMDDQAAAMSAMLAEEEAFRLSFANLSVPSVLMVVMMYTDVPAYYTQLIESLMKLKSDVAFDLLQVIAHGTVKARCPAVELLFQYYPELNPSAVDRKSLTEKHVPWQPLQCQHENCASSALSNEAVKLCIDHTLAIGSADKPPPMLICLDCADVIYRSKSRDTLMDILLPMEEISYTCENKTCKSAIAQKVAMVTCFSAECTNYNCNKPIRYCAKCHESKHISGEHRFLTKHMVQKTLPSPWAMDQETQGYLVEAVIALLKEAQPFPEGKSKDGSGSGVAGSSQDKNRAAGTMPTDESMETMALEERQLMSRYGVWLITSLCTPTPETPDDVLGRLLAMLFQWFHCTACLPDDQAGSALERLKGECIHGWLMKVVKTHFQVLANTLLPHPVDYAKVGGHWDCWPSQTNQIKEGFKRLLCLVPYDIITLEVWSHIMPFWMECFRHEVPEEELAELKILLSKVLDPDLSPLGFTSKQMYQFIAVRLDNSTAPVQEQALYWIQILTMLEVPVPIKILLPMLESAMTSLAVADRTTKPYATTVKIQTHISISSPDPGPPQLLSTKMRRSDSDSRAKVKETQPPTDKELAVHCYILMLDILVKQMELQEVKSHKGLATKEAQTVLILLHDILSAPWEGTHKCGELRLDLDPEAGSVQCLFCELVAIWHQLALSLIEFFSPMVEITMGDLQADPIIPPPKKNGDTGDDKPADQLEAEKEPEAGTVLSTAGGKYTFTLEKLPIEMQLFFALLHEVEKYKDADILYHILGSLKIMCLNAEVLNKAASQQRGFLVYCQENLLLRNLWALLQAEFSQISQLCVPLLLHCITLPTGRDMFWRLVEENFHDHNWKARFTAVERVTTVAHFVEPAAVKNSPSLQSSLANAFCYLVHCLDDIESTVAQRALLNLETIKISSLRLLIWCLETQFDLVMIDRPMILQTIFQLYNHLSDRRLLTWDFFLNRFDSLFLESQVTLEASGDLCQTRDLRNTNTNSEAFRKKVTRAQEALSHAHVARSLSASFTLKLPYKRAMSAPLPPSSVRQHPARQASAPTTGRRKSSRLTDQLPAGVFIPEKLQSHYPASIMSDNQLRELAAEEAHLMQVIHGYDQDDQDHDSMHLLITLMMQFLSRPDHSHPAEEKVIQRNQQLVLRHLNILLGYSPSEKVFSISPAALRELPVFNAFITSMPKVLDFNMKMGNILLTTCLPLLIYAPSPQKYFQELVHAPLYSLWHLHPHQRQTWLMVVQIIMYKYTYETAPASKQVQLLIAIVMNTLEAQFHRCKPSQHVVTPVPTRSRDMSTASIDLGDTHDHASDNENGAQASQPVSETEEEDDEPTDDKPELAAIPESPKREEVVKTEDTPVVIPQQVVKPTDHKSKSLDLETGQRPPLTRSRSPSPSRPSLQRMQAIEPETVTELADVERSEQNRIQQGVTQLLTNVVKPENPEAGPVTWTIGDSAPLKLLPGKPVPERLLPIGPQRPKNYPATLPPLVHPSRPRSDNMPLPAHERLLPIGPPPRDRSKSPGPQTGSRRLTSPQGRECNSPFSGPLPDLPEVGLTAEKKISEPTPIVIPPDLGPPPNSAPPVLQKVESLPVAPPVTQKVDPPPVAPPVADSNVKPKDKRQPSLEKEIKDEAANAKSEPLTTKSGDKGEKGEEVETSPDKKVKKKKVKKDKQSKSTPTSPKSDKKKLPNRPSAMEGSMESKRGKLGVLGHSFSLDLGDDDLMGSSPKTPPADQKGAPGRYKQRRQRKTGLKTIEAQRSVDSKCAAAPAGACAANVQRRARKTDSNSTTGTSGGSSMQGAIGSSKRSSTSQVSLTGPAFDEGNIFERCNLCANILEKFSDDELGMCIVILGTYVHREPGVAARILPDMLRLVAKFAINYSPYPWTTESSIHLPGNVACIARQFLRCVSYQLTSNGLFQKLFSSHFVDHELFKALSVSLGDFGPINQVSPLTTILGDLNDKKHLPPVGDLMHLLGNIADYLDTIAYENPLSAKVAHWDSFIANFDTFLKNLALILPNERSADLSPILRIMLITLKLPVISAHKIILDTYSKIISIAIQQYTLSYHQLIDICHNCSKSFTKDRDRFILSRTASFELFQAMKFKLVIPDDNFLILVQLILQDAGGTIVPSIVTENLKSNAEPDIESMSTSAADCMKQYVNDAMEFISDVHTILKIKSNSFGNCVRLNEESLGGHLKASLSQWVALDITRSNSRDHRAVSKYLPWLYTLPSVQQGPKEFLDCVAHIRVLSWLLLGSLQHSALFVNGHSSQYPLCQPIPLEANGHIAEHIQVILAGFAEQSKSSVLHMSSLFHAFILCQLWTMYCENISGQNPPGGEQYTHITLIMYDFWVKITPGILQLVCHSKVLAEMVSLHFLSLMEALMESNSNMLSRLLPMWTAVFKSYQGQLSSHLQVRLQACVNWQPPPQVKEYQSQPSLNPKAPLLRWLQKVQFKMSQIETQSSQATQFYPM